MQIAIGDKYVITSDKYQFILNKKMIFKEGKNAGEHYLKQVGFYPRLSQLIRELIISDVQETDIESLKELDSRIATFSFEIEKAFVNAIGKCDPS